MKRKLAVVVDLGGTSIKSAVCDSRGKLMNRRERPTLRTAPARVLLEAIAGEIEAHRTWARARRLRVRGIGIGTPGLADAKGRIAGGCPNIPHWSGTDAGGWLRRRFRLPVAVGNDANLAALGEWKFGAAKGARSCVLLTLGTGIGGGIVIDGRLFTGGMGCGTELGHMTIDRNGPRCKCGGKGCLEGYASATAILRTYNGMGGVRSQESGDNDVRQVFEQARKGDRRARRVVEEALETLGLAAAGLVNAFNPEVFVLGGGVSRIPGVVATTARVARRHAQKICRKNVRIVPAKLGNDAGMVGASVLYAIRSRSPR